MGSSPSIQDMKAKNEEFQAYLSSIQQDLDTKTSAAMKQMQANITNFYATNNYTDAKIMVQGQNSEFMHETEFSLENVKKVVDAISAAVFSKKPAPDGATVNTSTVQAAEAALGAAVGAMSNLQLYMASQVLDVMSSVLLNFGKSTSVSYETTTETKSLAYGLQMFTTVAASSYRSNSFFNNEYINQYLFVYDVRFSLQQSKTEQTLGLVQAYSNELVGFEKNLNKLIDQLVDGSLTPELYAKGKEVYTKLIADVQAEIASLKVLAAIRRPPGEADSPAKDRPTARGVAPRYQILQTLDGTLYCSGTQFDSHDDADEWVKACIQHFNIPASSLHRTFDAASQPTGAVIWP